MNQGFLSSLGPILAASWRQRRNAGSMWWSAAVVALLALAPALLFGWSLFVAGDAPSASPMAEVAREIRHTASFTALLALAVLVLASWAVLVSNILEQNRPVLARLVPHHPARLRGAMLVGWAAAAAIITLLVGVRLDAPLACAAAASVGLAFLAASVRWPLLWMLGCVSPIVANYTTAWPGLSHAVEAATALWRAQRWSLSLTLAAASAVLLVALIQTGGARHVASDQARRLRVARFLVRWRGGQPVAAGKCGRFDALLTRPYHAWWRHVFARQAAPVFPRVMLALGPGAHWTAGAGAVLASGLALFAGLALLQVLGLAYAPAAAIAPDMLASFSIGLVVALLSPAMQIQARLHQSRREQALLALLPGVPRGADLSRRLAWQLTRQFLVTWIGAVALAGLCLAVAHVLRAEVVRPPLLSLYELFAIASLPMVAFQWRPWARVGAPTSLNSLGPLLQAGLVAFAIWGVPALGVGTHAGMAALGVAAAVAWCALRWRRMGREPSALPIGRLA